MSMRGLAVAFALTWAAAPLVAQSKLPGVSFDLMPVGCRIHSVYGDGTKGVDEYLGQRGGVHIVRTFSGGKTVRTTTYNAQGFMTRKDWAGGKWETFSPFSCFARVGTCSYTYRNGDGADLRYRGKVTRRGDKIVSRGGFEGQDPFPQSVVTPGPFNAGEAFVEGDTTFRVTRYENCGQALPSS